MKKLIQRFLRTIWTYQQPLTHIPSQGGVPVSDLFIWRKGSEWQTTFELTDMVALYSKGANSISGNICIRVYDSSGKEIGQHNFTPPSFRRQQIDISSLVQETLDHVGTFAVFHRCTPKSVQLMGCHLAERGYVSYRFRNAPLRSYVHGNLDAVTLKNQKIELLGGSGLLWREYRVQYEMLPGSHYDIGIVNPSQRTQMVICKILACEGGKELQVLRVMLAPGACHLFTLMPSQLSRRVVIKSRLVMARPLIFRIEDNKMDVLHG